MEKLCDAVKGVSVVTLTHTESYSIDDNVLSTLVDAVGQTDMVP